MKPLADPATAADDAAKPPADSATAADDAPKPLDGSSAQPPAGSDPPTSNGVAVAKEDLPSSALSPADAAARAVPEEAVLKRQVRVVDREQAAGRLGGGDGRGIVYDDAAIERILDR